MVEHSWCLPISSNPMYALHGKMKRLKKDLKSFNQLHFGGLPTIVIEKMKELAFVQVVMLSSISIPKLIQLEHSLSLELNDLLIAEE